MKTQKREGKKEGDRKTQEGNKGKWKGGEKKKARKHGLESKMEKR